MIRDAAALKLARDILEPFLERDLCGESSVGIVAKLIQLAVETDEKNVELAAIESRIAGVQKELKVPALTVIDGGAA